MQLCPILFADLLSICWVKKAVTVYYFELKMLLKSFFSDFITDSKLMMGNPEAFINLGKINEGFIESAKNTNLLMSRLLHAI